MAAKYTIEEIFEKTKAHLKGRASVDNPRLEAEYLIAHSLKCNRIDIYLKYNQIIGEEDLNLLRTNLARRAKGEPMAYILGTKGFYKNDFSVTPDVLIPRPETELLVEEICKIIEKMNWENAIIADWGTGSGAIGLSLLTEFKTLKAHLVDISPAALQIATANATKIGVSDRCFFINKDIFSLAPSQEHPSVDIIVGNPPYIPVGSKDVETWVAEYEPKEALFSGEKGLDHLAAWINKAPHFLNQSGCLALEHGFDQAQQVQDLFCNQGFVDVYSIKDLSGYQRHTVGFKK